MIKARRGIACVVATTLLLLPVVARVDTLLVVRRSAGALDFFDPGSGLRLASVGVGSGPCAVEVAPDGRLAVVANCGTPEQPGSSLSVVDLAEPRELRRIDLAPRSVPRGLDWYAPDRVAVTMEDAGPLLVIDPLAGAIVSCAGSGEVVAFDAPTGQARAGPPVERPAATDADRRASSGPGKSRLPQGGLAVSLDGGSVFVSSPTAERVVELDSRTLAVLRTLVVEGEPAGLALTRVMPRAACHACKAE